MNCTKEELLLYAVTDRQLAYTGRTLYAAGKRSLGWGCDVPAAARKTQLDVRAFSGGGTGVTADLCRAISGTVCRERRCGYWHF